MSGMELVNIDYDRILDDLETPKAFCFIIGGEKVWLPKSQVEDIIETQQEVVIPEWLAMEKGLI